MELDVLFIVVNALASYNVIFDQTIINRNKMITSTIYRTFKFPISHEIDKVIGDKLASTRRYVNYMRRMDQR